jgi:hypothetical protein
MKSIEVFIRMRRYKAKLTKRFRFNILHGKHHRRLHRRIRRMTLED